MEKQKDVTTDFTKAERNDRVSITTNEAIEYREFKRQKKRAEILGAIARSEGDLSDFEDVKKVREQAMRLRQAAVRMSVERLYQLGEIFTQGNLCVDCVVGGDGKTIAKVKAYEARAALRKKAREITLMLSPYSVATCRFEEIRKEIRRLRRVTARATFKVGVDKAYSPSVLSQIARTCCELGAAYFCVPYFEGCERLVLDLKGGCKLQVSGVDSLSAYKKLCAAGVWRIVTSKAGDMYAEWMKEVEKINFPELLIKAEDKAGDKREKPMESKDLKGKENVKGVLSVVDLPTVSPVTAACIERVEQPQKTAVETIIARSAEEKKQENKEEKELKIL